MKIPKWIAESLGKDVYISKPHNDGLRDYPAGSKGRLTSIQAGTRKPFATVVLYADPLEAEDNFHFGDIRPA